MISEVPISYGTRKRNLSRTLAGIGPQLANGLPEPEQVELMYSVLKDQTSIHQTVKHST
jgi:hypothetical protein